MHEFSGNKSASLRGQIRVKLVRHEPELNNELANLRRCGIQNPLPVFRVHHPIQAGL